MPLMLFFEVFATEHWGLFLSRKLFLLQDSQKLIIIIRLYINGSISKTHLCNVSTVSLCYYRWVLERDLMILKKDK